MDRVNYFETLAASDENLEFAIALEADRMNEQLHQEVRPRFGNDGGAE